MKAMAQAGARWLVEAGLRGDYSEESLADSTQTTIVLGCYVGEVLERNHGGQWPHLNTEPDGQNHWEYRSPQGIASRPLEKMARCLDQREHPTPGDAGVGGFLRAVRAIEERERSDSGDNDP
jgi:hypothetical protein